MRARAKIRLVRATIVQQKSCSINTRARARSGQLHGDDDEEKDADGAQCEARKLCVVAFGVGGANVKSAAARARAHILRLFVERRAFANLRLRSVVMSAAQLAFIVGVVVVVAVDLLDIVSAEAGKRHLWLVAAAVQRTFRLHAAARRWR